MGIASTVTHTHTHTLEYTKPQIYFTSCCYGCETRLLAQREEHRPILCIGSVIGKYLNLQEGSYERVAKSK
jgi:hypothetical protein